MINQNGLDVENVVTDEDQSEILLQTDYVKPFGEKGQFELGYRGSFQELTADYLVEQERNGQFVVNDSLSNILNFKTRYKCLLHAIW